MMTRRGVIAVVAALAAVPAFADDLAQKTRDAMRAAMLEHAPLPSGPAALPDRSAPVMPRVQLARSKAEADRAARAHAVRNAAAARAEAANHAAMRSMMSGSRSGGGVYGCDNQLPADMMKSRGMMPGGGTMPGHSSGGGGGGMPGGGMLEGPGATSTGAPSGAPIGGLPAAARR